VLGTPLIHPLYAHPRFRHPFYREIRPLPPTRPRLPNVSPPFFSLGENRARRAWRARRKAAGRSEHNDDDEASLSWTLNAKAPASLTQQHGTHDADKHAGQRLYHVRGPADASRGEQQHSPALSLCLGGFLLGGRGAAAAPPPPAAATREWPLFPLQAQRLHPRLVCPNGRHQHRRRRRGRQQHLHDGGRTILLYPQPRRRRRSPLAGPRWMPRALDRLPPRRAGAARSSRSSRSSGALHSYCQDPWCFFLFFLLVLLATTPPPTCQTPSPAAAATTTTTPTLRPRHSQPLRLQTRDPRHPPQQQQQQQQWVPFLVSMATGLVSTRGSATCDRKAQRTPGVLWWVFAADEATERGGRGHGTAAAAAAPAFPAAHPSSRWFWWFVFGPVATTTGRV
jgi:hypothetical protein